MKTDNGFGQVKTGRKKWWDWLAWEWQKRLWKQIGYTTLPRSYTIKRRKQDKGFKAKGGRAFWGVVRRDCFFRWQIFYHVYMLMKIDKENWRYRNTGYTLRATDERGLKSVHKVKGSRDCSWIKMGAQLLSDFIYTQGKLDNGRTWKSKSKSYLLYKNIIKSSVAVL